MVLRNLSRFVGPTSVKAALLGAVRNPSFSRTGRALHRIDFVSCQHRLLHRGEARSVAGRAGMLFDLRRHDEPFRLPSVRGLFPLSTKKWPPCGLRTKTILDAKGRLVAPVTKTIMSVRPRCAILLTFLFKSRAF